MASKKINIKIVKGLLAQQGEEGWSIADLARALGYTPAHVRNVLVGCRQSTVLPNQIAQVLGVPVDTLYSD